MTVEVAIDGGLKAVKGFDGLRIMLRQICMDYSSLPDVRTLSEDEIIWFYDGLRPMLRKRSGKADSGE